MRSNQVHSTYLRDAVNQIELLLNLTTPTVDTLTLYRLSLDAVLRDYYCMHVLYHAYKQHEERAIAVCRIAGILSSNRKLKKVFPIALNTGKKRIKDCVGPLGDSVLTYAVLNAKGKHKGRVMCFGELFDTSIVIALHKVQKITKHQYYNF